MKFKILIAAALVAALAFVPSDFQLQPIHVFLALAGITALDSLAAAIMGPAGVLAATGATVTSAAAFLKRMYSPKFVSNTIGKKESRAFNQTKKIEDGSGDSYNFAQAYADNPSGSATFSNAQTTGQTQSSAAKQFNVPYYDEFSVFTVSAGVIARSKNKAGAWLPQLRQETDSALRTAMHRKSVGFYTSGWGELGIMGNAAAASAVITLSKKSHVFRFYQGMPLVFASTLNTSALRAGTATVLGVDYNAGTVTIDQNTNAVSGLAQNDWIFTAGDRQSSVTPTKLRMTGLGCSPLLTGGGAAVAGAGWMPTTAPAAAESFFGVDRSTNSYLRPNVIDLTVTPMPIVQALTTGAQMASSIGNAEKLVSVCSPVNFTNVSNSLQGQVRYTEVKGRGGVSFKTVEIFADGIEMALISDKYCPDEAIFGFDPGQLEYVTCGPAPALEDTGGELIKQSADAGVEGRWQSFETLAHRNPASGFVINTGSTT